MSKQPIAAGYMTVTCIDNSGVEEYLNIDQSYTLASYNSDLVALNGKPLGTLFARIEEHTQ